jgi:putative RNA 2'-phosphotransferase
VDVEALLAGCARAGRAITLDQLDHIVVTNAKKRFEFSHDGTRIGASQGHSVEVDLQYEPMVPPEVLYLKLRANGPRHVSPGQRPGCVHP